MSEPNPELVWQTMTAHQRSAAMRAGVELGVFDALGDGPATAAQLSARCGGTERSIRILCDALIVYGLLAKNGDQYCHTPTSAVFLDSRSPASMAPTVPFLMNKKVMAASAGLTETVRRGHTSLEEPLAGEEVVEWVTFAQTMHPMMAGPAQFIADTVMSHGTPTKVLDVAASHGQFSIAIARKAPDCQLVALDFPSVLEVTKQKAEAAGVKIQLLPGSVFTVDLGTGYDAILVTNLFHHFSAEVNTTLMRRLVGALRPGGRMYTLEFVPNADRITPPAAASFAMMMLANTPEGDAFTLGDYAAMLANAGFAPPEMMDVPQSAQRLIVAQRPA